MRTPVLQFHPRSTGQLSPSRFGTLLRDLHTLQQNCPPAYDYIVRLTHELAEDPRAATKRIDHSS